MSESDYNNECQLAMYRLYGTKFTAFLKEYTKERTDDPNVMNYDINHPCIHTLKTFFSDLWTLQVQDNKQNSSNEPACKLYVLPVRMVCTDKDKRTYASWELKYIPIPSEQEFKEIDWNGDIQDVVKYFFGNGWDKSSIEKAIVAPSSEAPYGDATSGLFLQIQEGNQAVTFSDLNLSEAAGEENVHGQCKNYAIVGDKNSQYFDYSGSEIFYSKRLSVQCILIFVDTDTNSNCSVIKRSCCHDTNASCKDVLRPINETLEKLFYIALNLEKFVAFKKAEADLMCEQERTHMLTKESQMLQLLAEPLNNLTEALQETQKETQRLRAVMYAPHRSLFSVASNVLEYFEEGRRVKFGQVSWETEHNPNRYTNPFAACATIASIVCVVFGHDAKLIDTPLALHNQMNGSLVSRDKAYKKTRKVLNLLLWAEKDTYQLQTSEKTEKKKGIQDSFRRILVNEIDTEASLSEVDETSYKQIKTSLGRLKDIIFTPFKDGEKRHPWLSIFLLLFDANDTLHITCKLDNTEMEIIDSWEGAVAKVHGTAWNLTPFSGFELPVPRFSMVLALISGVISYARAEKHTEITSVNISVVLSRETEIICTFNNNVFGDMNETFNAMADGLSNKLWLQKGNFMKPFVDFAVAASTVCSNPKHNKNVFTMKHNGSGQTSLAVNGKTFIINTQEGSTS